MIFFVNLGLKLKFIFQGQPNCLHIYFVCWCGLELVVVSEGAHPILCLYLVVSGC